MGKLAGTTNRIVPEPIVIGGPSMVSVNAKVSRVSGAWTGGRGGAAASAAGGDATAAIVSAAPCRPDLDGNRLLKKRRI